MHSVSNAKTRDDHGDNGEDVPNKYYLNALCNVKLLPVPMPTSLNFRDRGGNLQTDGIKVTYTSSSTSPDEPCIVRANHFIPPACGLFYFEVIVKSTTPAPMAIGLCTKGAHKEGYLPGQERHSQQQSQTPGIAVIYTYGYESSRGDRLGGTIEGERYGPSWGVGDTVGCCIDYTNDTIHFTKNGTNIGVAFQGCGFGAGYRGNMFPCVGLSQRGQSVEVNFGTKPFCYDLTGLVSECRESARTEVLVQASSATLESRQLIDQLVLDYLRHHGFSDTAARFARDIGQTGLGYEDQDARNRRDIFESVTSGNLKRAVEYINRFYPNLLQQRLDVMFAIKCQMFIEIIRNSLNQMEEGDEDAIPSPEAVAFGRRELVPLIHTLSSDSDNDQNDDTRREDELREKQRILVRDVFSLLAYRDPRQSPVSHLLEEDRRHELARKINRAALKHTSRSKETAIERIARQGQVVIASLVTNSQLPIASLLCLEDFM